MLHHSKSDGDKVNNTGRAILILGSLVGIVGTSFAAYKYLEPAPTIMQMPSAHEWADGLREPRTVYDEQPAQSPSIISVIDAATDACANWRTSRATLTASEAEAARSIAICNVLVPGSNPYVAAIPGAKVRISLDPTSFVAGFLITALFLCVLAKILGPRQRSKRLAGDTEQPASFDRAKNR